MKKYLILILSFALCLVITGCAKETEKTVLNKIEKKVNNSNGYQIEANMELINNEDSYKYDVTVSYKKKNNFRVSLRNKANNHEQIILKNDDGVYVLSPSLNKSFKFQSTWPYNNSQSYLVQSIINDMKNDSNLSMEKVKNNYVFKSKVNYKNNANLTHQKITVDNNYNIKKIVVYDTNENAEIKVDFNTIDLKAKFDKDYFDLDQNMEMSSSSSNEETVSKLDDAIYPMYIPSGTYLDNEREVDLVNGSRIILTFKGTSPFMLVEEKVSKSDEMNIIPTSGDIDLFANGLAIVDETSVSFINDGIEYYLVSTDISKDELLSVATSMSSMPISK